MYKIIGVHKKDAFYQDRKSIIGLIGTFEKDRCQFRVPKGFLAGSFYVSDGIYPNSDNKIYFCAVKVEEVK